MRQAMVLDTGTALRLRGRLRVAAACLVLLHAAVLEGAALPALRVRDPNASFPDVAKRRQELKGATTQRLVEAMADGRSCTGAKMPAPPPPSVNIPSRYMHGGHGAVNPDEGKLSQPYYDVQNVAAWGANRYLETGDAKEAACVVDDLYAWAQGGALLKYNAQDDMVVWFQTTWTSASLSLSVSVIRAEPTLDGAKRDAVIAWLNKTAKKVISEHRHGNAGSSENNHFFWRGLAATAAGVISSDDALFNYGLSTYKTALDEMDGQGAFPLEMQRHELALHYQAFAIEPLVMIAELAGRQGLRLFGFKEKERGLADAVRFLAGAMRDPAVVKRYTPEEQTMSPDLDAGSQAMAWLELWNARFGESGFVGMLQKPYFTARLSGSTTLYAAPVRGAE